MKSHKKRLRPVRNMLGEINVRGKCHKESSDRQKKNLFTIVFAQWITYFSLVFLHRFVH
jgi:hypothetical protein